MAGGVTNLKIICTLQVTTSLAILLLWEVFNEREPSTRQVRIGNTLGIHGKPWVAFRGHNLGCPGNQAKHV